jgi:hypothetical protein
MFLELLLGPILKTASFVKEGNADSENVQTTTSRPGFVTLVEISIPENRC